MRVYEVGGCVRDDLLGLRTKDIDFAVEADSYEAMRDELVRLGFEIFVETEQYYTIRARFPTVVPAGFGFSVLDRARRVTADFVLCRKDGVYSDFRRPDDVQPGSIYDDLARRDFTMNAIARRADGSLIDPHDGQGAIANRMIICVGEPRDRLREDPLRALRAIRFSITKRFAIESHLLGTMCEVWMSEAIAGVSAERRREELRLCMRHDTVETVRRLASLPRDLTNSIFSSGLWLDPTLKEQ